MFWFLKSNTNRSLFSRKTQHIYVYVFTEYCHKGIKNIFIPLVPMIRTFPEYSVSMEAERGSWIIALFRINAIQFPVLLAMICERPLSVFGARETRIWQEEEERRQRDYFLFDQFHFFFNWSIYESWLVSLHHPHVGGTLQNN